MKKLLFATILSAAALFSMAAQSNSLQPLAVVKYNGHETVSLKEVKEAVETYQTQAGRQFTVEEKKQIIESIVDQKLIVQAARKEGISVNDSQVDQVFLQNMAQLVGRQGTENEYREIVRQKTGKTLDEFLLSLVRMNVSQYKTYLKNQLLAQQYVIAKKGAEINAIQATDKEIRDFYELNKAKIESLRNDYTSKKLTLDAMRNAAKNPAASGYVAGDLMLEKTEQYAQALGVKYENILEVFRSEKNKASELLETEVDYQFYVVLEKYNAKMLGLSDVVTPGSTVTVYEYIKANITNQKKSAALLKAVQDISRELNVPANVERKKTGAELDALLSW